MESEFGFCLGPMSLNWRARLWPHGDVGLVVVVSFQKSQTFPTLKLGEQNDIPFGLANGNGGSPQEMFKREGFW